MWKYIFVAILFVYVLISLQFWPYIKSCFRLIFIFCSFEMCISPLMNTHLYMFLSLILYIILLFHRFATLATRMEQYIQGQSRDLVDQAYTKFVSAFLLNMCPRCCYKSGVVHRIMWCMGFLLNHGDGGRTNIFLSDCIHWKLF